MGDHAWGDCKKVICSSGEEELLQEARRNLLHISPTVILVSQLNLCSRTLAVPGTSGEALVIAVKRGHALCILPEEFTTIHLDYFAKPAVPTPPATDDADRQFWAEDEMSSSDSRFRLVCKQKRRRSLAYRNRVATRQRSNSLLYQSSSSNSDSAVHSRILSPIRCNARRRRKHKETRSSFTTKKAKVYNASVIETSTPIPQPASKIPNSSTLGGSLQFGGNHLNWTRQMNVPSTLMARREARRRRSKTRNSPRICDTELSMNNESQIVDKCGNQNPRPPSTPKRK